MLKKLQEMKSSYEIELSRMLMMGGVTVEHPNEFGTPVSIVASAYGLGGINIKSSREKNGQVMSQTSDYRFQYV